MELIKKEKRQKTGDEFLDLQIDGCTWSEIKEMFKVDANNSTKQIYYFGKLYQCEFVGYRCTGAYIVS